jgi:(p)ppGpp synthase/HD superfamily hydrolase
MQILEKLAEVAAQFAHAGQKYDDIHPYMYHLTGVRDVAKEFGITDDETLASCLLHDTIEDTQVTFALLTAVFGPRVALIVFACTDERGKDRKEKHIKTYPKILATEGALEVKLSDRIFNTRNSKANGHSMFNKYKKEYLLFKGMLYSDKSSTQVQRMWSELDALYGGSECHVTE